MSDMTDKQRARSLALRIIFGHGEEIDVDKNDSFLVTVNQIAHPVSELIDSIRAEATRAEREACAKLEAGLRDCKRYAEDHDDEWVPHRVDDALAEAAAIRARSAPQPPASPSQGGGMRDKHNIAVLERFRGLPAQPYQGTDPNNPNNGPGSQDGLMREAQLVALLSEANYNLKEKTMSPYRKGLCSRIDAALAHDGVDVKDQ